MRNLKGASLIGVGLLLGCGVATTLPHSVAAPTTGSWTCYEPDDFDNPDYGANEPDAKKYTSGMNEVAYHAPAGTVFDIKGIVCVKR